jgi:hypothetical protein
MKTHLLSTLIVAAALCNASHSYAKHSTSPSRLQHLFAEESEEHEDEGPPDAVVKKLGAMMDTQTFDRKESIKSDGKHAPKDATVYPIEIKNAEGKVELKLFFFKGDNGKWSVYDEAGNVMHET